MGRAMAPAMAAASSEYQRCWRVRTGIPSGPLHWAGSVSQATTSLTTFTASPPTAPGPGGEPVLQPDQQQVGGEGQQRREHDPDDDQGGDGDQPDGGDGGDADAGDDDRQGQRQLDLEQLAGPGVAHRLGGLADVGVDAPQPLDHVPDQDQQGVDGQPDQRRLDLQPGEGDQQDEQGQRGDGEQDPGEAEDRAVHARPADRGQGQREGQQQPEQQGQAGELDVLDQVAADVVEVVADPRPADQLGRQDRGGAVGQLISLDSSSRVTMPS